MIVSTGARPTLQTIVDQAVLMTAASTGWLLAVHGDAAEVVAVAGSAANGNHLGRRVTPTGAQGYVLLSGQAAALLPQPDDPANDGAAGFDGVPPSVLAVPCGDDAVGVLEVADKGEAPAFTFDDIEILTMLGAVAAAALVEAPMAEDAMDTATPADLLDGLQRLAATDPRLYRNTAQLILGLLDG